MAAAVVQADAGDQRLEIMALFQELNRQGMTVVLVTHEPDVARFAQRIIAFRDGKVVQDERNEALAAA